MVERIIKKGPWSDFWIRIFACAIFFTALILFAFTSYYKILTSGLLQAYHPLDDAFMFVRYAKHILSGYGIVWNIGEPSSYGITSALYLMVVTIARGIIPLTDTNLLMLLSWFFGLSYVLQHIFRPARGSEKVLRLSKTRVNWTLYIQKMIWIERNDEV